MRIQALIFSKQYFTQVEAEKWLVDKRKRIDDLWETQNSYKYYQLDPLAGVEYFTAGVTTGIQVVMMVTD